MAREQHQLNGHEFEQIPGDSGGQGEPGVLQSMGSQRGGLNLATEQQYSMYPEQKHHLCAE